MSNCYLVNSYLLSYNISMTKKTTTKKASKKLGTKVSGIVELTKLVRKNESHELEFSRGSKRNFTKLVIEKMNLG